MQWVRIKGRSNEIFAAMFFHELVIQRAPDGNSGLLGVYSRYMILGRVSFWACSCFGLDKIGVAMQRRRRLLDIARLPRVIFNHLFSLMQCWNCLCFPFHRQNVSPVWCVLFSQVRMMSGKGNIWQPVILNSSHILNYFNRRYVSPLYVCSLLSGADDFRKGKHLAACDPQQLSYSQLFQ